jgi:hypothetical protein
VGLRAEAQVVVPGTVGREVKQIIKPTQARQLYVQAGDTLTTTIGEEKTERVVKAGERLWVGYRLMVARVPNDGSTRQQRRAAKQEK